MIAREFQRGFCGWLLSCCKVCARVLLVDYKVLVMDYRVLLGVSHEVLVVAMVFLSGFMDFT